MGERLGIDVGGTFTDFVHLDGDRLVVHKTATTSHDQSRAIERGVASLAAGPNADIAHGTTTATNALLERRGARCALVTTRGFRDVLAIGRQNRPHLYRLAQHRPPPLVADELRFEVSERVAFDGTVITPLDDTEMTTIAARLEEAGVESVAVVFLFSFRNAEHERRAAEILADLLPNVPISVSSEILPEYREYERTATTVVNAYVQPLLARYIARLEDVVAPRSVRVMQSNGGTIGTDQAARQPARLVLSGPAGGVVGAFRLAGAAMDDEAPSILTLDMGGTSTDVALCPGVVPQSSESTIAGLPLRLPTVDIETVGAGGGSIAHIDAAGALHVGPTSAGADPGPACYGRGGIQPTVTDAHLVLGRLRPDRFLGGEFELDAAAAYGAVDTLGRGVGLSPTETALGIVRIANASMERALRRVSVERGYDPHTYTLVPFGGAGPLHACDLADALGITAILLPPYPGVLSALGLLMADVVYDASMSVLDLEDELSALFQQTAAHVHDVLAGDGRDDPEIAALIDVRYVGQSYELTIPIDLDGSFRSLERALRRFHTLHERRYGHAMPDAPTEVVTLRVRGTVRGAEVALPRERRQSALAEPAAMGDVVLADGRVAAAPIFERDTLRAGHSFSGPAVVVQYDTTTFVPDGWLVDVDSSRNLRMRRRT